MFSDAATAQSTASWQSTLTDIFDEMHLAPIFELATPVVFAYDHF